MKTKPMARIEDWFIGPHDLLYGKVYGHHRFPDGTEITTSRVVRFDREKNQAITLNTEYILGEPRKK